MFARKRQRNGLNYQQLFRERRPRFRGRRLVETVDAIVTNPTSSLINSVERASRFKLGLPRAGREGNLSWGMEKGTVRSILEIPNQSCNAT